jgi:hypothetical protein
MKANYFLGLDVAKQKVRAALSGPGGLLWEKDLPVSAAGRDELLAQLQGRVPEGKRLLVVLEATGVLHLNWSAALAQAGYAVAVINPLIARRLYRVENALRDNKTDPIDARGLCEIGRLHGEKLLAKYRFRGEPERFALQRLETVRKALRRELNQSQEELPEPARVKLPRVGRLTRARRDRYPPAPGRGAHPGGNRAEAPGYPGKELDAAAQSSSAQSARRSLHGRPSPGPSQRPGPAAHPAEPGQGRRATAGGGQTDRGVGPPKPRSKSPGAPGEYPRLWSHSGGQSPGLSAQGSLALGPAPGRRRPAPGLHGQRPAPAPKRAMARPNQNEQARGRTFTHRLLPGRLQRRSA